MQLQSWLLSSCLLHLGEVSFLVGGVPYDLTPGHPVGTIHTILIEEKESVLP